MSVTFQISKKTFMSESADVCVVFVGESFKSSEIRDLFKYCPVLPDLIKARRFIGKRSGLLTVPFEKNGALCSLVLGGLGQVIAKKYDIEAYRRVLASAIRHAQAQHAKKIAVQLPAADIFGVTDQYLAQQTAIIGEMAAYNFATFKTTENGVGDITVTVVLDDHQHKSIEQGLRDGALIGRAVNDARELVNLPSNVLRPEDIAVQARQVAKEYGLTCTVFNAEKIKELGMGGIIAVGQGSVHECRFILLQYTVANKKAPTLGFVGKGVTFDTGGVNLKTTEGMRTQKGDMAGASAVLGAMKVLAQLKPNVNIVAAMPLVENMPSGAAAKPDDIVRFYNGTTCEIRSTDAEGRLILADALAYVVKQYKPNFVIDLATLTGACERAIGPFFSGLFSRNEEAAERVMHAASIAGDAVWRLPLTIDYMNAMNGTVSDLMNTSNLKGRSGATTAAVFLAHFVGDCPWVHIDIAGTSIDVPELAYQRVDQATGVGVRLLVELARSWKSGC